MISCGLCKVFFLNACSKRNVWLVLLEQQPFSAEIAADSETKSTLFP